jgi:conjugative relaxase-like TrwC/TraI family protein
LLSLSQKALKGSAGDYYLNLAQEDYYLEGGEPPGVWLGKGAKAFDLHGTVEREAMKNLLQGRSADGQEALVQIQHYKDGRERQQGWDLTFSAPKSVSVLWSQADSETRQKIQDAHFAAVKDALQYLEETASFSRRGKAGCKQETARILIATFEHGTSRALDPQLHTHCLVVNVAVRQDGTTGTLLSQPFYQHKMTAGALYRASLSAYLGEALGLECVRKRSWFELHRVPEKLSEFFSKRRQAIEARLGSMGLESASAAAFATLATREAKELVPSREKLFAEWQRSAQEQGLAFDARNIVRPSAGSQNQAKAFSTALGEALNAITAEHSHFSERELLGQVAQAAQGRGLAAQRIRNWVRAALTPSKDIVRLGELEGEVRYTTRETLAVEKRLLDTAWRLRGNAAQVLAEGVVEKIVNRYSAPRSPLVEEFKHHARQIVKAARGAKTEPADRAAITRGAQVVLSAEQADAVRHLTTKPGSVVVLSGMAGTGKTSTLRACREAWEKAGFTVLGASLAGKAAKELAKGSGIKSDTLALLEMKMAPSLRSEVKHHAKQLLRAALQKPTFGAERLRIDPKTVLVVDEAGMVGTKQMARLLDAVQKGGGKLVLVGDARQLQPIEAGAPFAALAKRLGAAELNEITRQRDERDREVVRAIARGEAGSALKSLAQRGLVTVAENRSSAREKLVSDWSKEHAKHPEKSLIFCGVNAEAEEINRRCQAERALLGHVNVKRGVSLANGDVFVGDRVLFTKKSRSLGVENGETGTVLSVERLRRLLTVKLDDGERVVIPLKGYKHERGEHKGEVAVRLGYAVTTHKGQGTTIESAYVMLGGSMQDREISEVQASRARGTTRVYCDALEAGKDLTALAKHMNRSRSKSMAHDIIEPSQSRRLEINL